MENTVRYLQSVKFSQLTLSEKVQITKLQKMIRQIPDLNEKVINHFSSVKQRRMDFIYK